MKFRNGDSAGREVGLAELAAVPALLVFFIRLSTEPLDIVSEGGCCWAPLAAAWPASFEAPDLFVDRALVSDFFLLVATPDPLCAAALDFTGLLPLRLAAFAAADFAGGLTGCLAAAVFLSDFFGGASLREGVFLADLSVEDFGAEAFLTEAAAAAAFEVFCAAAVVRGFLGFFVPDDATMFRPWFLTCGRRERKV